MSEGKSLDLLGTRPIAEAARDTINKSIDGIGALLSRICLPAAEELGLHFRDRVSAWRSKNVLAVTTSADEKLSACQAPPSFHASPRLVGSIIEQSSWIEDAEVQDMWAGLLASSCNDTGDDDSNLLFVNLLSALTRIQACILRFACEHSRKFAAKGLILACPMRVSVAKLIELTGERDIQRLDRELDHLRATALLGIKGGFDPADPVLQADLTPTALALHMYVRCQGVRTSPVDYFGVDETLDPLDVLRKSEAERTTD